MSENTDPIPEAVEELVTVNMAEFSSGTREFAHAILAVAEGVFGKGSTKTWEGSCSASADGKVIAKVVPWFTGSIENVIVGVRSEHCPESWVNLPTAFDGPLLVMGTAFHFYLLPGDRPSAKDAVERVFRELKVRLPVGN